MTKKQINAVIKTFNNLNHLLKIMVIQPHIKNKDVVEEIRLNMCCEIERLISFESESEEG